MSAVVVHAESIAKIIEIAGSQVETLKYFESALNAKINQSNSQAEFTDVKKGLDNLTDNALYQEQRLSQIDLWSGAARTVSQLDEIYKTTEFSGFQEFMASKSVNKVPVEKITLDCIVGDDTEFKRAYSIDGQPLEGDALDAMDTLFNAWLAQPGNNMIMKDGFIFAGTDNGEIAQDRSEAVVRARAEKVRAMLNDSTHGFEHYVQQKKTNASVAIIQHQLEKDEPMPS